MWLSNKVFGLFRISQEAFDDLREEQAALRAERDTLKSEVISMRIQSDWLRMRVNALEVENKALLEKAYGVKLPAPEIARAPQIDPIYDPKTMANMFDDVGDEMAKKLGYPSYDN